MAYDINSALETLEQNLKDLDSARQQVTTVVASSKELQEVVDSYIQSMSSIYTKLKAWESDLKDKSSQISREFVDAIQRLNTSCTSLIDNFKTKVDATTKSLIDGTKQPLLDFNKSNQDFATSITQLTTLYGDFKLATAEIKSIKDMLDKLLADLAASQGNQDNVLDEIKGELETIAIAIEKQSTQITDLCSAINTKVTLISTTVATVNSKADNLSTRISDLRKAFDDGQKAADAKIENLQIELTRSVNINRWLILCGIITMIILHFA